MGSNVSAEMFKTIKISLTNLTFMNAGVSCCFCYYWRPNRIALTIITRRDRFVCWSVHDFVEVVRRHYDVKKRRISILGSYGVKRLTGRRWEMIKKVLQTAVSFLRETLAIFIEIKRERKKKKIYTILYLTMNLIVIF